MKILKTIFFILLLLSIGYFVNKYLSGSENKKIPQADFKAEMTNLTGSAEVHFIDLSTKNPVQWNWRFGDGNVSNDQNPVHTYKRPGSYTVELLVSNEHGYNRIVKENYITISAPEIKYSYFLDNRNNKTYKTIELGNRIWMAENLNYNTNEGSWAYNKLEENAKVYGRLYNWQTACNVCPEGWRLPFVDEWKELINSLGDGYNLAGDLKEKGFEHWIRPNKHATNYTGFKALPGGLFKYNTFDYKGYHAFFWTASKFGNKNAWSFELTYGNGDCAYSQLPKEHGLSVRCIKNK